VKCPVCDTNIEPSYLIPDEQKFVMKIAHEAPGQPWLAATVGGIMTNTAKLLKAIAKREGAVVEVFIPKVECDDPEMRIHFVIVRKSAKF